MLLATEKSCPLATEVDKVNELAEQFVTSIKKSNKLFKDTIDVSKEGAFTSPGQCKCNASIVYDGCDYTKILLERQFALTGKY